MRKDSRAAIVSAALDRRSLVPLHRQVYEGLRDAILTRRLRVGTQLPPTRELAGELGVSRNTVVAAFEQLLAEGYVVGKSGSGTFVASELPDDLLRVGRKTVRPDTPPSFRRTASRRGLLLADTMVGPPAGRNPPRAFQPGLSAIDEFPLDIWTRLVGKRLRRMPRTVFDYGEPDGFRPLREAIASYLGAARGVRCEASQVLVVGGSQQGLDLAGRVLLDPGNEAWIEDPGYVGARGAWLGAGARLIPVPLDAQGIDVAAGERLGPNARAVYVTPSHQYPSGVVMSLSRRLELLEWAERAGAWIVEDDYDGEFRYAGRPLTALQGLDANNRVIYVGTFSKVLFPSLRLGYLVVPSDLAPVFSNAMAFMAYHAPVFEQVVLTDFIVEGHFSRHIRRMRSLYGERQAVLVEAARVELAGLLDVSAEEAGMHLVGRLPEGIDDLDAFHAAREHGVYTPPLSFYRHGDGPCNGLLLGYTGVGEREIRQAVGRLRTALETVVRGRTRRREPSGG